MEKKILITGIGSGIGRALAKRYLREGWEVFALSRSEAAPLDDGRLRYLSLDLAAIERIEGALGRLLEGVAALDLVVLNAGVLGEIREMAETSLADIEVVMRINVWANKVILDTLRLRGIDVAQVVGISSGAAVNGNKGWGAYSLSKASLNMLLRLYAAEMPRTHITALAPGVIDTPMVRGIVEGADRARFPSVQRLAEGVILPVDEAAERLVKAFDEVKSYASGSFLDVRKM